MPATDHGAPGRTLAGDEAPTDVGVLQKRVPERDPVDSPNEANPGGLEALGRDQEALPGPDPALA
jgi:hypothetical protein